MAENRVSAVLSQADRDAVVAAIETIRAKLPFLVNLTPDQRRAMLKLGDKSVAFVNRASEVAAQNTGLLPAAFELAEWQKDADLLLALRSIEVALNPLSEAIDDTLMVVGSEAYVAALSAYQYLKAGNQAGQLDGLLDELGRRFARRAKAPPPPA
jgi:hypothetical protein